VLLQVMTKVPGPRRRRFIAPVFVGISVIAFGALLFRLRASSAAAGGATFSAAPVAANYPAPDVEAQAIDGTSVRVSDLRSRLVIINLWATWCPPCRLEMPVLEAYYRKHKSDSFEIVAIDQQESTDIITSFVLEYQLTFPIWLDANGAAQYGFHTGG